MNFLFNLQPLDNQLDEDSKLQAATIFDGLRVISNHYQHSSTPVFLGGLFAYDLVANFIPMQGVELKMMVFTAQITVSISQKT